MLTIEYFTNGPNPEYSLALPLLALATLTRTDLMMLSLVHAMQANVKDNAGAVYAYSGKTGKLLWKRFGKKDGDQLGTANRSSWRHKQ